MGKSIRADQQARRLGTSACQLNEHIIERPVQADAYWQGITGVQWQFDKTVNHTR